MSVATLWAQDYKTVPVLKGDPYAQNKPSIEHVRSTPLGYVIVGLGFGGNPSGLRVLENGVGLPASSIVGASAQRISVHSVPQANSSTAIVVEVDGSQSSPFAFSYSKPVSAANPELGINEEVIVGKATAEADTLDTRTSSEVVNLGIDTEPDLGREVLILQRRVEALEQEIYVLKRALTNQ